MSKISVPLNAKKDHYFMKKQEQILLDRIQRELSHNDPEDILMLKRFKELQHQISYNFKELIDMEPMSQSQDQKDWNLTQEQREEQEILNNEKNEMREEFIQRYAEYAQKKTELQMEINQIVKQERDKYHLKVKQQAEIPIEDIVLYEDDPEKFTLQDYCSKLYEEICQELIGEDSKLQQVVDDIDRKLETQMEENKKLIQQLEYHRMCQNYDQLG